MRLTCGNILRDGDVVVKAMQMKEGARGLQGLADLKARTVGCASYTAKTSELRILNW